MRPATKIYAPQLAYAAALAIHVLAWVLSPLASTPTSDFRAATRPAMLFVNIEVPPRSPEAHEFHVSPPARGSTAAVPRRTAAARPERSRVRVAAPPRQPTAAKPTSLRDPLPDADPVDFGDSIVLGATSHGVSGRTQASGTSSSDGQRTRDSVDSTAAASDRSQAARLAGATRWNCPFPSEADDLGIDHAVVQLSITVDVSGEVRGVVVLTDPGDGFADAARRCAERKAWLPGLDRHGSPARSVARVNVTFAR